MNTRFLLTLCAVAESGSLAAAARQLRITGAAAGEQMQALEAALGARLVARQGRNVVLTDAGQAALPVARDILSRLGDLKQLVQLGALQGSLRVGSISTALISVVPPALQEIAQRYPRIELKVIPGTSDHLFQLLQDGDIDCAIVVQPHFKLPKHLGWNPIRAEPLVLLTPPDLPGKDVDRLLTAAPFIRVDRKAWTGKIVSSYLKSHGLHLNELFEMDAQEAVVILVSKGLGVTLLPDWGIVSQAGTHFRKIPIGDSRYDRQLGLLWRRSVRERLVSTFDAALQVAARNIDRTPIRSEPAAAAARSKSRRPRSKE